MRTVQAVSAGCALAGVLVLAGCGASTTPSSTTAGTSGPAESVRTASSSVGTYLVDSSGHALYVFAADTAGHSNCTGSCLTYWPIEPAPASIPSSPAGVTATLGVLARPDGAKQLTIDGLPAYTYAGDTAPGTTAGQGVNASGGIWWLITPDGHALTAAPAASPATGGRGY